MDLNAVYRLEEAIPEIWEVVLDWLQPLRNGSAGAVAILQLTVMARSFLRVKNGCG